MDINECISFTTQSIDNLAKISAEKKKYYYDMLKNINRRNEDPFLNVAMIGDFSTGKSTFINGLIKQDLLKTAHTATTAIPTHIYYQKSNDVTVYVDTIDGGRYNMTLKSERQALGQIIGRSLPGNIKELITVLTSTNGLEKYIKLVRICTPMSKVFKDICIIDTPGVNPGGSETKHHVEATRNALREYADATIVLLTSDRVFTNSFGQFLNENAQHFKDDAIFVITKMDINSPDEDDQQEIIDYAKNILKSSLGIANPMVFGCCARNVNKTALNDEDRMWNEKFDELRNTVITYMSERRERIIKKQINVLLKQLIQEVDADVQENTSIKANELKILEENSIEKLKNALQKNKFIYKSQVKNKLDRTDFDSIYNDMFSYIIKDASADINTCTVIRGDDSDAISYVVKEFLPISIDKGKEKFQRNIKDAFEPTTNLLKAYAEENKKIFMQYSVNLSGKTDDVSGAGNKEMTLAEIEKIYFDGGNFLTDTVEFVGAVALLPLALVDEFLGTGIADGIYSILEGITGTLINFFGDLEGNKAKAISKIKSSVNSAKSNGYDAFKKQMANKKEEMLKALSTVNDNFTKAYEKIYNERYNAFMAEKEVLEQEIAKGTQAHNKFTEYLNLLK